MRQIVGKAYTELGKELYEAQQGLSKKGYGCFEEWFTTLGFKKRNVYRLIDRYKLVRANLAHTDLLEDLPVSLTYEISGKSSESTPAKTQAKSEVLADDIDSLKEYRKRIKELEKKAEQAEQQAEAERMERERLEVENEELANREPETVVKTEYIEVHDEYTEQRAEQAEKRLKQYEERFGDIRDYDEHITASHRQDMIVAVMSFSKGVREFIKRYDYMNRYKEVINNLDEESRQQYNESVKALKELAESFEYTEDLGDVIDANSSEII